jgi:zinc protease
MRFLTALFLVGCAPKIERGPVPVDEAAKPPSVVRQPNETSPNIYLAALVRAGSALDPVGKEGLAHLTAQAMVEGGAGDRAPDAIRQDLHGYGNNIEVLVDREWVSFRLRCHADHALACAELFGDVLTSPGLDPETVQRLREESEYAVSEGILSSAEALGDELLDNVLFAGHPYGHPVEGRSGVIPLLTEADTRSFHGQHYLRSTTWLGLAGNIPAGVDQALEERLGTLPSRLAPDFALPQPEPIEGRRLLAVRGGSPVTGFHLGHPLNVTRDHPDWAPLATAFVSFGAHRQSFGRLFRTLRSNRGLNYGDYAYIEPFVERSGAAMPDQGIDRQQPYFSMWIRPTSNENGAFALKLAIDELEILVEDGLTEAEFEDVRSHLRGYLPLLAQDPGRRLLYALDEAATGRPNPLDLLPARLDTMTLGEINAAIAAHIHPETIHIVAVSGDADQLAATLVEETETPIVYADIVPSEEQADRDAAISKKVLNLAAHRVIDAEGALR